ncbi:MAG: SDR family oxidoreductase [Candidatus Omnitrophota bacterium]
MKILITGATGYLGGAIVREAALQGLGVRALCRRAPDPGLLPPEAEIALGDILEPDSLHSALHGCEAVIHSAALVSIWERDPGAFYRVNVNGMENVMNAAMRMGTSRVIYTSSFFALGPTDAAPADENWDHSANTITNYAKSKAAAEKRARQFANKGLDIVIVYPAFIYGPGKATQGSAITKLVEDFVKRKVPGTIGAGDMRMTFSYVDDVVKGHLLALEKGRQGERYILGGEDASLAELFEMLEEITGVRRPRRRIPFWAAKALGAVEEWRARLSSNYLPRLTRDVVDIYKNHWRYSSQKAIAELGYSRTPLKMGLWKTLESLGLAPKEKRGAIL